MFEQNTQAVPNEVPAPVPAPQSLSQGTAADTKDQADNLLKAKGQKSGPKLKQAAINGQISQATEAEALAGHNLHRLLADFEAAAVKVAEGEREQAQNWAPLVSCMRYILLQNQRAAKEARITRDQINAVLCRVHLLTVTKIKGGSEKSVGISYDRLVAMARFSEESLAGDSLKAALAEGVEIAGKVYSYANGGALGALKESGRSFTFVHNAFASVYAASIDRKPRASRSLPEAVKANADKLSVRVKTSKGIKALHIIDSQAGCYVLMTEYAKRHGGKWSDAEISGLVTLMRTPAEPEPEVKK
jgi:hypothetical protein